MLGGLAADGNRDRLALVAERATTLQAQGGEARRGIGLTDV